MDSTNLTEIFTEFNNSNELNTTFTEKCICLAQAINQKETTIHVIVEHLGTLLVNQMPEKRALGTLILSEILEHLPNDLLTATELHFITTFYADRLKDHVQVIPAVLQGLVYLVDMKHLPEGAPRTLLTALFDNISCQLQLLKERQNIYEIFKRLLNNRTEEIRAMGLDFVLGFIQAMDGERDPRNLLTLFNWLPIFFSHMKLGHLAEEMFDVLACYFPVDFRISSQETQNITREDLAASLCPCLCALPEFSEFCIPLIIDKLNSSLKIAKYDSLQLLTASCKTFNVSVYEQYSHNIWNILQNEILNSSDPELEEASLNATSAIVNCLSKSENFTGFAETMNNLYDSLKGNLRPDTKLFISTSKLLLAIGRASIPSSDIVVLPTVTLLLNQYKLSTQPEHQEILFRTLMEFTVAYVKIQQINNVMDVPVLQDVIVTCLHSVLNSVPEIPVIAYENIRRLAKSLPIEIREKVYELFDTKLVENDSKLVRNSLLKCLNTFCTIYTNEIREREFLSSNVNVDVTKLELYLEALCVMINENSFIDLILPKFLSYSTSDTYPVSKLSMKWFRKLLENNSSNKNVQEYLYGTGEILKRITVWVLNSIRNHQIDLELLDNVSTILKLIVGYQTKEQQELILNTYLKQFLVIYEMDDNNKEWKEKIIVILEGFLLRIRSDVEIPEKFDLIKNLLRSSSFIQTNSYLHACKLIANILNKCIEDEKFSNILTEIEQFLTTVFQNGSNNLEIENSIQLVSWITKSLIIKGSDQSYHWTDKLISLLNDHEAAGKSFQLILDDNYDCLSSKSYCTNRLLYRQKFFAYVCRKLSNDYNANTPNYLIALGYLLQLAPLQVVILYFKEILRLVLFCLESCKQPEVLSSVLNTLCTLIEMEEQHLENHIDELLPRFLKLTTFDSSMNVRIAALKCIEKFPKRYPVYKLLPHKQSIIFGLNETLDDKKRLVRRQAVETRSCWFLMDAPI